MSKEMVISANPHETRVAILEEGQLCEYYVEREKEFALVGSIYKGRVTRVLPGMQSAFVEIGLDSDAFLYVTDFLEGIEEFDHIVTTVEDKVQKMEDQGGKVFSPEVSAAPALEPTDVEPAPPADAMAGPSEGFPPEDAATPPSLVAPVAPVSSTPPSYRPASQDRGRFGSRGRDFGRRGGRRGGRPGSRREGGGRGGSYGRDLPPSKYASHRPYEDRSSEAAPPGDYVPIILPGESLAKYREKPPSAAPPVSAAEEAAPVQPIEAVSEPVQEEAASAESAAPAHEFPSRPMEPSIGHRPSLVSGLEPLPGETLSKYQHHEPAIERHLEPPAPPAIRDVRPPHEEPLEQPTHDRFEAAESDFGRVEEEREEISHAEDSHAELSEDEAAALAQHVAEAQIEEAARVEQDRSFAADEEAHDAGLSDSEQLSTEADREREIEDEEADAEAEGMIAPLEESEQADAIAAAAESVPAENGSPLPGENPPQQEQQPWQARVRDDFRARMQHPARRGRDRGRRDDRGRRPQHGHGPHGHHRPQPRRPMLIADLLKQGQEIIVQIAKEPLGKKGARITSHVALPGRYLVYMPTLDHTGVSRKIASAEDRARLRHLVNDAKGTAGGGFIVRTAAASAPPDEVRADVEFLTRTWSEIKSRSEQRKAPSLLHRDLNLVERILRDFITPDFGAIWVDSEEEYTKVVDFMSRFQPQLVNRVKLYTKDTPVFEEFGIQQEIDKGLRPKVWLKSGGYIVINHTEALVAIDVNTGKFVGKGSNRLEDTIVRTNLEAVKEIVRQMRLRDLGGIIVIDFIDMEDRRNREKVMAALEDALRADRAPSKMLRFNEFGLIAITRKRTKQALERTLCQPCPYCTGSGMVKSIPTLCYEIQTEARKMAPEMDSGSITLRVHPEIAKALKTRESGLIEELERWTKKSAIIQADPTLHWEQYDIY